MNCPNCGLPNPDTAKFCSNCGTSFVSASPSSSAPFGSPPQQQVPPPPYQAPNTYPSPVARSGGNSLGKNIGIGCLILLAIFLLLGLSCTRACLHLGRSRARIHTRYY